MPLSLLRHSIYDNRLPFNMLHDAVTTQGTYGCFIQSPYSGDQRDFGPCPCYNGQISLGLDSGTLTCIATFQATVTVTLSRALGKPNSGSKAPSGNLKVGPGICDTKLVQPERPIRVDQIELHCFNVVLDGGRQRPRLPGRPTGASRSPRRDPGGGGPGSAQAAARSIQPAGA